MKIAKLETFTNQYVGFVRVTADTGDTGWGQVSTYHADITCQVFHRQVARHALGQPAYDFDDLLDRITEREHKFPGSYLRRAMAGSTRRFGICAAASRASRSPRCSAVRQGKVCAPMPRR
jgi:L-alanine-DL-glutamate epimerase-like enolase superfamily enzyme